MTTESETTETPTTCTCGSGRRADACHDQSPRRAWAMREVLQALGEGHDAALFFPWLRPPAGTADHLLAAAAARLGPCRGLTPELHAEVEAIVAGLDPDDLRAPSLAWRDRYPERWRVLARLAMDEPALERTFAAGAVTGAIRDRMPVDPRRAGVVADIGSAIAPPAVLALVLDPSLVWDRDDATLALEAFPGVGAGKLRIAEEYAPRVVGDAHLERVRARIANLAATLPDVEPRAARALRRAVRHTEEDEDAQVGVACLLLEVYAWAVASIDNRPGLPGDAPIWGAAVGVPRGRR